MSIRLTSVYSGEKIKNNTKIAAKFRKKRNTFFFIFVTRKILCLIMDNFSIHSLTELLKSIIYIYNDKIMVKLYTDEYKNNGKIMIILYTDNV